MCGVMGLPGYWLVDGAGSGFWRTKDKTPDLLVRGFAFIKTLAIP